MKNNSSRLSVLVLSMLFLILFEIFGWKWTIFASLIVGLTGIFSSYLSSLIETGLALITKVLGYITQTIFLAILFYLILFPISMLYKLFHKDALMLSSKYESHFIEIKKDFEKETLEKPW